MTKAVTSPRTLAVRSLGRIIDEGLYSEIVMDEALRREASLSVRDQRLYTKLVYTTLIHLYAIDQALNELSRKPISSLKPLVRNALRSGLSQLLYLGGIKPHAAVYETVELVKRAGFGPLAGYVNGVLQQALRNREDLLEKDAMLPWLFQIFSDSYGAAKARELWALLDTKKHLCLRITRQGREVLPSALWDKNEPLSDLRKEEEAPFDLDRIDHKSDLLDGVLYLRDGGGITDSEAFRRGYITIQDESSIMAAWAMDVRKGERILDLCAAPGGKTFYMAEAAGTSGRIVAQDIHPHRIRLLEESQKRLRLTNIETLVRDGTLPEPSWEKAFDGVLVDAPCSGLGMLRSKPDILLRRQETDIGEMRGLQAALLDTACAYVRPGGRLIYSTCTLNRQENEDQVQRFLENHPDYGMEALDYPPDCGQVPGQATSQANDQICSQTSYRKTPLGLTLFPVAEGREGFFIARLVRRRN